MTSSLPSIATAVVQWQASHGRNHLPWQQTRDPYRVWLSEIMLQQTQVSTVLGYYDRFLARFPDVAALAAAHEDEVLALWAGLGYYSRARNLHKCAQAVVQLHGGAFPSTAAVLATLPGIGRSTAAAIASFCFAERVAILDANVKRVLTRVLAYGEDLSSTRNEKALWALAEALLPTEDLQQSMPRYTQGLMDLGAGICLPRKPSCLVCPLHSACRAIRQGQGQGNPEAYPVKTRKLKRQSQPWALLLLQDGAGRLWLQRRPTPGIWAGLYAPPIAPESQDTAVLEAPLLGRPGLAAVAREVLPTQLHVLTHRDLYLHPVRLQLGASEPDPGLDGAWYTPAQWAQLGLPAPIRKLLDGLES